MHLVFQRFSCTFQFLKEEVRVAFFEQFLFPFVVSAELDFFLLFLFLHLVLLHEPSSCDEVLVAGNDLIYHDKEH